MQITMERSLRPWLDNDFLFNLTALGKENRECVRILHDFTNQVSTDSFLHVRERESDVWLLLFYDL